MVSGQPDDLDDSSFSRNLLLLVETQMMDMDFQIEVKTSIWYVTAKVKSKVTICSLGGRFKLICNQWKAMGKTD